MQLRFVPYHSVTIDAPADATLTFYRAGTSEKLQVYSDEACSIPFRSPITANAQGEFPTVYLCGTVTHRLVIESAQGITDLDPFTPTQAQTMADSTALDLVTLVTDFNTLLAKLRAAGVLKP